MHPWDVSMFDSGIGYLFIIVGLIFFLYGVIINPYSKIDNKTPIWLFGLAMIATPLIMEFFEATPEQRKYYFKIALLFVLCIAAVFIAIRTIGVTGLISRIGIGLATSIIVSTLGYVLG